MSERSEATGGRGGWRSSSDPEESIVTLHFSPVLISRREGGEVLDLRPDRLEGLVHRICEAEESEILRSDFSSSHVHLLLRVPPKHSVRQFLSRLRHALAHRMLREYRENPDDYWALHLWEWELAAWGASGHDELEVTRLEGQREALDPLPTWKSPFAGRRSSGERPRRSLRKESSGEDGAREPKRHDGG